MAQFNWPVVATLFLAWATSVGPAYAFLSDKDVTISVWTARQNQVHSFTVEWDARVYSMIALPPDPYNDPIPQVNRKYEVSERYLVDGNQYRLEVTNAVTGSDGKFALQSPVIVSAGSSTTFFPKDPRPYPVATVDEPRDFVEIQKTGAIRLFYRPLEKLPELEDAVWRESKVLFEGRKCGRLDFGVRTIWVTADPERLPMRIVSYRRSKVAPHDSTQKIAGETVLKYRNDEKFGSVLDGWKYTYFGVDGHTIIKSAEAVVTRWSINEPISPDEFKIALPFGTWVQDVIKGETRILREGKPDRIVMRGEFTGQNYEQLLNSEPIYAPPSSGRSWYVWLAVLGVILVLIGLQKKRSLTVR